MLDKGYCDCNEMNCIDNNSPRRILNIVKVLQTKLQQEENIIKEVREYIENEKNKIKNHQYAVGIRRLNKIEEILDKASDE